MNLEQFKAFAAEHPEAVAAYIEQGKKAGAVEAHAAELTRFKAVREACKGDDTLACNTYEAGKDAEDAKFALDAVNRSKAQTTATSAEATAKIEAQAKEIERLKAEAGTQGAIGTSAAAKEAAKGPTAAPERPDTNDRTAVAEWAKAAAKHEWDTNPETHKGFSSEANYVSSRAAELRGDLKILKK